MFLVAWLVSLLCVGAHRGTRLDRARPPAVMFTGDGGGGGHGVQHRKRRLRLCQVGKGIEGTRLLLPLPRCDDRFFVVVVIVAVKAMGELNGVVNKRLCARQGFA